jgi:dolichol-phosphate mannosyltransferase
MDPRRPAAGYRARGDMGLPKDIGHLTARAEACAQLSCTSTESVQDADARLPIVVVVPCYKVRRHIASVIAGIRHRVLRIYIVDDCCPEQTGRFVQEVCHDPRITVLFHTTNQGVGAAVITGYRKALEDGHHIVVKMDGDNQMNPSYLQALVTPLLQGDADYAKGNRFFDLYSLAGMPSARLFGNAGLSFISKMASGYWDIMDPTNGYTAIHRSALTQLPLDRIERRYFFECDMLFRLATIRAVVRDVPMPAIYGSEESSLRVSRVLPDFAGRLVSRFCKRFFYMYILRDFNMGSLVTLVGIPLVVFGLLFGVIHWIRSSTTGEVASTGTVMLAVLPIVIGVQLLLSAIGFDIANRPDVSLQRLAASPPGSNRYTQGGQIAQGERAES